SEARVGARTIRRATPRGAVSPPGRTPSTMGRSGRTGRAAGSTRTGTVESALPGLGSSSCRLHQQPLELLARGLQRRLAVGTDQGYEEIGGRQLRAQVPKHLARAA